MFENDLHRPRYHFLPPANWMNDPNGLIQFNGEYHLFYQHFPGGAYWSDMHWGHARSRDLVHWEHLPIALKPDMPYDNFGVFSGCAVVNDGVPTVVYTAVQKDPGETIGVQLPAVATSQDLITWTKYPDNPVIRHAPTGVRADEFRDHVIWREGDEWMMLIGSAFRDAAVSGQVGGTVLLYASPDLVHWQYLGPLCVGNPAETGDMWECPDFFALSNGYETKHVLIVSPIPYGKAMHMIGTYRDRKFVPETLATHAYGGSFYAPQSVDDEQGRRVQFGWLMEKRSREAQIAAGWSGVMSLPRTFALAEDGALLAAPVDEVKLLRRQQHQQQPMPLNDSEFVPLNVRGRQLELDAVFQFDPDDVSEFGLVVARSANGEEQTRIVCDVTHQQIYIDRSRSQADQPSENAAPCPVVFSGAPVRLHVFVDGSVIEVYVDDGRHYFADRIYPTRADSMHVGAFAIGRVQVSQIDIWELNEQG